jgi:hypothetical protein
MYNRIGNKLFGHGNYSSFKDVLTAKNQFASVTGPDSDQVKFRSTDPSKVSSLNSADCWDLKQALAAIKQVLRMERT